MAPHLKVLTTVTWIECAYLKAKFNLVFIEYFYSDLKIIALVQEMFLRKMQIKKFAKTWLLYVHEFTVAVPKTPKFFLQQETNLCGWNVLGMKISFELLAESTHFSLAEFYMVLLDSRSYTILG